MRNLLYWFKINSQRAKLTHKYWRGPVLFIPPTRSKIYGTNSVHFLGSLIWKRLPNLVKSSRSISEFKNVIKKKSEVLTAGAWYVEGSTFWVNFHVILILLCVLWYQVVTRHLTLYSIKLAGYYMIGKNADNVEHLGYWLRAYYFVSHLSFYIRQAFSKFC